MAKSYNLRQVEELNIEQQNAIELLILGKSDGEVGEAVGVSRQTVCAWRNQNASFAAELERHRQSLWASHHDKLRAMLGDALSVLSEVLSSQDDKLKLQAAVHILRAVGTYGESIEPVGSTSERGIELDWSLRDMS